MLEAIEAYKRWVRLNKDYVQSLESLGFNRMATGQVWVGDPPIPRSHPTPLCSRGNFLFLVLAPQNTNEVPCLNMNSLLIIFFLFSLLLAKLRGTKKSIRNEQWDYGMRQAAAAAARVKK